jgi:hypothetical protein
VISFAPSFRSRGSPRKRWPWRRNCCWADATKNSQSVIPNGVRGVRNLRHRTFLCDESLFDLWPIVYLAGLRSLPGLGGVIAFPVNSGNFAAHGAQVRGQLPAMMNGVPQRKTRSKLRRVAETCRENRLVCTDDHSAARIISQNFLLKELPYHCPMSAGVRTLSGRWLGVKSNWPATIPE